VATLSNMPGGSLSHTVEFLTPIWRRVLDRKMVRSDENFFDLGGSPDAARAVFAEINGEFGRELCPLLIYQAPTILKLAAFLDLPEPLLVPPLLPLNNSVSGVPVFVGHGIGGSVDGLFRLAQGMKSSRPIYGMQARGIDGKQVPHNRIEDMARYHLDAIRRVQPRGPYFLVGYSLSGLIVIEIARRLAESGERIGLLAMLDSYPHIGRMRLKPRVRLNWQRGKRRVLSLVAKPNRAAGPLMLPSMLAALERVKAGQEAALRSYKPSFYDGKVTFIKASKISHFPDDPGSVWRHVVREFECHSLPCDHVSMLTTHADALASMIEQLIQKASATGIAQVKTER